MKWTCQKAGISFIATSDKSLITAYLKLSTRRILSQYGWIYIVRNLLKTNIGPGKGTLIHTGERTMKNIGKFEIKSLNVYRCQEKI